MKNGLVGRGVVYEGRVVVKYGFFGRGVVYEGRVVVKNGLGRVVV